MVIAIIAIDYLPFIISVYIYLMNDWMLRLICKKNYEI